MSERSSHNTLDLDLLTWFELNKKAVVTGLALIVVAIGVVIVWKYQSQQSALRASNSLILAKIQVADDASLGVDELTELAAQYPSHPTAVQAQLLAAQQLFTENKFSEARVRFEIVAASSIVDLSAIGHLGIAACLEAESELDQALNAYQKVADLSEAGGLKLRASLAKARLHESMDQPAQALAIYDSMESGEFTAAASEARMRRAELLRKNPELDTSNTVTNTIQVTAPPALSSPVVAPPTE
jgi:predicted negative regulator of RcsB-dependent stress response